MDLVPIKVRIDRMPSKSGAVNAYPEFNLINRDLRNGLDWASFLDDHGSGMLYGKEVEGDNAKQYCIMCVPEDFALEAVRLFGDQVEEIDESTLDVWYESKGPGLKQPENIVDTDSLQSIAVREQLGEDMTVLKAKALNLKDDTPGITENKLKTWARRKVDLRIEIVERLRKPRPPV